MHRGGAGEWRVPAYCSIGRRRIEVWWCLLSLAGAPGLHQHTHARLFGDEWVCSSLALTKKFTFVGMNMHIKKKKSVCGGWWIISSVKDSKHWTAALVSVWSSLFIFNFSWIFISHRIFLNAIQMFLISIVFPAHSLSPWQPWSFPHLSPGSSWCS